MRCCTFVSLAVTSALLGGCGSSTASFSSSAPRPRDSGQHGGSTVITGETLQEEQRSLLELLELRLPAMRVVSAPDCPHVHLRGRNTIVTRSDPAIYLDGQRVTNTCILEELSTVDLARVEVYPSGIPRGGYRTNPNGVILIFVRKGEELVPTDEGDTTAVR